MKKKEERATRDMNGLFDGIRKGMNQFAEKSRKPGEVRRMRGKSAENQDEKEKWVMKSGWKRGHPGGGADTFKEP